MSDFSPQTFSLLFCPGFARERLLVTFAISESEKMFHTGAENVSSEENGGFCRCDHAHASVNSPVVSIGLFHIEIFSLNVDGTTRKNALHEYVALMQNVSSVF